MAVRMMHCKMCKTELVGKQRMWCSPACCERHRRTNDGGDHRRRKALAYAANPDKYRQYRINSYTRNPERTLVANRKNHCKRGVEFTITESDIKIPVYCPVLGIKLGPVNGVRKHSENSPSIDRFNPKIGYVPGNVRVISHRANQLKSNGTLAEMRAVVQYMEMQSKDPTGFLNTNDDEEEDSL